MLISVIVPVYNVEKYIEACLDSIIELNLDCEVIMIDDGSKDKGPDICKTYVARYQNFSFFFIKGKGTSEARNMGLEKARGEYIWFVDSDDLVCGDIRIIELQTEVEKPDVIAFDAIAFNETRDVWNLNHYDRRRKLGNIDILSGKEFFENYYLMDAYRDSACLNMYKKAFLNREKIQFSSGLLYEDTAFTFHAYMRAKTVKYIPQIYYKRRYRVGSTMTTGINEKKINDFFDVLEKNIQIIKANQSDGNLKHIFARYLFDMYSVQIGRINQSDVSDKERYYIKAFEAFSQAFQNIVFDRKNLSNINMILIFMNRLEDLTGLETLERKSYEWQGKFYNWDKLKQEFFIRHKLLVSKILKEFPLDKEILIGIYGIGKHTERMLEAYRMYVGPIKANMIFFDSDLSSHTALFDNREVLNIRDIPKELDLIIISSYRYQNEMYQCLKEIRPQTEIIRLYLKAEDTFDYFI